METPSETTPLKHCSGSEARRNDTGLALEPKSEQV